VDEQVPTRRHLRSPPAVVAPRHVRTVAPVDEEEVERTREVVGDDGGLADETDDGLFEAGVRDGPLPPGERIETSVGGIDEGGVVVLPARLVLLAPVMVVEGAGDGADLLGREAEVGGGLSAPRPDL
jgi:hypothetical protein